MIKPYNFLTMKHILLSVWLEQSNFIVFLAIGRKKHEEKLKESLVVTKKPDLVSSYTN